MNNSDFEDIIFGKVLRELREVKGKSQEGLGLDSGLTRNFVSLLELGQRRPTLKTLIGLARGLEIPLSEIIAIFEDAYFKAKNKHLHTKSNY